MEEWVRHRVGLALGNMKVWVAVGSSVEAGMRYSSTKYEVAETQLLVLAKRILQGFECGKVGYSRLQIVAGSQ